MAKLFRVALTVGIAGFIFFIAMAIVDKLFWSYCGGVDIHQWSLIWVCENIIELQIVCSILSGLVAGSVHKSQGLIVGFLTALFGFLLFSFLISYPFGSDNIYALKYGFLNYILPAIISSVLGAKLTGSTWKNAF